MFSYLKKKVVIIFLITIEISFPMKLMVERMEEGRYIGNYFKDDNFRKDDTYEFLYSDKEIIEK